MYSPQVWSGTSLLPKKKKKVRFELIAANKPAHSLIIALVAAAAAIFSLRCDKGYILLA